MDSSWVKFWRHLWRHHWFTLLWKLYKIITDCKRWFKLKRYYLISYFNVLVYCQWLCIRDILSIQECIINKFNYGYCTCALVWLSTSGNNKSKQHTFPLMRSIPAELVARASMWQNERSEYRCYISQILCLCQSVKLESCQAQLAEGKWVGLVIQCLRWGRGSIPTPDIYSAAIPLGKELTVPSLFGWDLKQGVQCLWTHYTAHT